MRRKPAILLFALLLLLSIGGAVFHQQLRKNAAPGFEEIDHYLRHLPGSSGWRLRPRVSHMSSLGAKPDWWSRLIRRGRTHDDRDVYYFTDARDNGLAIIVVLRKDGKFSGVSFGGTSPAKDRFKELMLGEFPQLRYYQKKQGL